MTGGCVSQVVIMTPSACYLTLPLVSGFKIITLKKYQSALEGQTEMKEESFLLNVSVLSFSIFRYWAGSRIFCFYFHMNQLGKLIKN